MPPTPKQRNHLEKKARPQAVAVKKDAERPIYAALKASNKKSFANAVTRLLRKPKTAAYDPAEQRKMLSKEWCAGLLPDDYEAGFCDLQFFLNELVNGGVTAGITTVNNRTKKVERIKINPALGFFKAKHVLADTTVHEGICHGGPVADGLFSTAAGWPHGPDFQKYAELAGDKTGIKVTAELPKDYANLIASLMMQLPYKPDWDNAAWCNYHKKERARQAKAKKSKVAELASKAAEAAVNWVRDRAGPICHKDYAKQMAELKKVDTKGKELTCRDVYMLLKKEKEANEAAEKDTSELSSASGDEEDSEPAQKPRKTVPRKKSKAKSRPAQQRKPKKK